MRSFSWSPARRRLKRLLEPTRTRRLKFWDELVQDLLKSAWTTLVVYFLFFITFYLTIRFDLIADPSQLIADDECSREIYSIDSGHNRNLVELTRTVHSILDSIGLQTSTFLCYSTLFDFLHYGRLPSTSKRLDLCVYDSTLEHAGMLNSMIYSLGWSTLQTELNRVGVHYEFNRLFGYFQLHHLDAQVYLYLFGHSPANKYWFESIRRFGIFYLQFERVFESFGIESTSGMLNNVNLLNRFQTYMIDEMFIRVNVVNASSPASSSLESTQKQTNRGQHECCFFSLPVDPFDMLASFYPNSWHLSKSNCAVDHNPGRI